MSRRPTISEFSVSRLNMMKLWVMVAAFVLDKMHMFLLLFVAGICLGLQCAVIEFGRNVLGWEGAHSTEAVPATPHPVVSIFYCGCAIELGDFLKELYTDMVLL